MKNFRWIILIAGLLVSVSGHAQVQINLSVNANPSPRISEWVNRNETAMLTVTNSDPRLEGVSYKIQIRLSVDGRLVAETHTPGVPVRSLVLGTEVFLADEVIPYDAVRLYGDVEKNVMQTGMLPAGHYTFCVSLLDLNNNVISTPAEVCRSMMITSYQPPELVYPHSGAELDAGTLPSLQFSWSPLTPMPPPDMGVKYVLVISEVYPRQSPSQALLVNYPLIEEEIIGATRMMWPPELEPPTENTSYVWSVKALSLEDEPYHKENEGFAAVNSFTVTPDSMLAKMMEGEGDPENEGEGDPKIGGEGEGEGEGEENEDPPEPPAPGEGELAAADTLYAGENGEFMIIASNITDNNGTYSGQGTIFVNWLKASLDVAFDSITVDNNKHLVTGEVLAVLHEQAPVYPLNWVSQAGGNLAFSNNDADDVLSWVENSPLQNIPYNNPNELMTPVKLPLGLNFSNGSQVAITEMAFRNDKSEFNLVTALALPYDMGTQRLGFLTKNVKFHPSAIELPPERLELVEDFSIGNVNNDIVFQFNKPEGNNLGCYIEWDEDGFSEYGLQLTALFTRDWLIPSPDTDPAAKVAASLSVQGTSWTDLILGGTMERAEIPHTGGITILTDSIFYDFSDVLNPPGIVFPENYPGDTTELFRGFYMKAFEIEMPETWQTQAGNQPKIGVHNMIINNTGLTMLAQATSVVQFPEASVADLAASIDTVHVEMIANSLVEAGIKGRIGLPVSKQDSIPHPLEYIALFNNPITPGEPVSFQLTVTPTGPVPAHMLKGELELAQTSNIVAYIDEDKRTFDIVLNGSFNWPAVDLGPVKDVSMGLTFQGLGMNYDSSNNNSFGFSIGSWAFASEQKFLANFPVTIENIDFTTLPAQQNQLVRGRIGIDVIFNLTEDIGGMAGLGVEMAFADNVQGQKFYPQYLGTSLDSIAIQANMAAVSIEGAIGFRNEHPVFGNGFIGTISADFKPAGIQASVLAEFGNTAYQNNNELYRYWRVEADLVLPPPGVVFLPGLAFRGFGGGAYFNMEATLSGTSYSFSPLKSQLGFQAKAVLATTPSEDGFNADVILAGEFNLNTGGLTFINFTGDFWVGADLNTQSRAEAIVNGGLGVTYNFPNKHFNMFANVNVNAPPITTPSPVGLVLDINGQTNQWFFKFGEPGNLNMVSVFGVNIYQYLMFGNYIPMPSGFTSQFSNAYYNAVNHYPGTSAMGSGGVGPHTNTGSGFALGIGFMFDHNDQFNVLGNYYVGFNLGAGAELHLAFLNYSGSCSGYNPIGINGWRASGGLGMYATAGAKVHRIGGLLADKTWNIADLAAGAWVYGEFPNPYYAAGAISGHAYVFKIINVHFHREFEVGNTCNNQPAGTSVTVSPGDVAADQQDKLVQYVHPTTSFNFPTDEPLAVKYGLVPDEVFDVAEQQADGTIIMRTFKMETSAILEIQEENGSWSPVMLNNTPNVLGEYLYTTVTAMEGFQPAQDLAGGGDVSGGGSAPGDSPGLNFGTSGGVIYNFMGGGLTSSGNNTNGGGTAGGPGDQMAGPANLLLPYPSEPPQPGYGDLPPSPTPPENNLEDDRKYRFTVTATLMEYENNNWVNALTKEGDMVSETVIKQFSTGPMPPVTGVQLPAQTF